MSALTMSELYVEAVERGDAEEADRLGLLLDGLDRRLAAREASPGHLLRSALWYAEQGIDVFPLAPRRKTPLTPSGFKDASCSEAQIRAWWATWPEANIGAPTGRRFDVIDVDGVEGLLNLVPHLGEVRARSIGVAVTPRDAGLHFYVAASGAINSAGRIVTGVDTRGQGGYVVLPPSVTDQHGPGRRYWWAEPLRLPSAA